MPTDLLVTLPEYHLARVKPRNFDEFTAMFDARDHGPLGLWELMRRDTRTGKILSRLWARNVITDSGGTAMLKNTWNAAGSAVAIYDQIAITFGNQGSTSLTTALTAGQTAVVSLAVNALPAQILSGTQVVVSYGTSNADTFTLSATAAAAATSISVTSQTSVHAHAIGDNVVPVALVSDNPTALTNATYSGALAGGAFTYSGTGAGNRQVQIIYTFPTSSAAGNYTEAYTVNTNPVGAAGETASHLIFNQETINSTTSLTVTINEKV